MVTSAIHNSTYPCLPGGARPVGAAVAVALVLLQPTSQPEVRHLRSRKNRYKPR